MKPDDIQSGRRYYVAVQGGDEACIVTVIAYVDSLEEWIVKGAGGSVQRLTASAFLAPVPHNWLRRLMKGGE